MSRPAVQRIAIGALCALTAAGCSSSGQSGRGPAPAPDVRPLSGATAFTHEAAVRLHDLEERAVTACMADRGFRYLPQPADTSPRAAQKNPYGLLTEKRARQDGYGIVGEFLHLQQNPPPAGDAAIPAGLDERRKRQWQQALTGTPRHRVTVRLPDGSKLMYSSDGCVARSQARLYGAEWDRLQATTGRLAARVHSAVEAAPAYRAAIRTWSRCMADSGYRAGTLDAPQQRITDRLASATATTLRSLAEDEIRTATTDAACQSRTRLAHTLQDVQNTVTPNALTPADQAAVDRFRALKQRALQRRAP